MLLQTVTLQFNKRRTETHGAVPRKYLRMFQWSVLSSTKRGKSNFCISEICMCWGTEVSQMPKAFGPLVEVTVHSTSLES